MPHSACATAFHRRGLWIVAICYNAGLCAVVDVSIDVKLTQAHSTCVTQDGNAKSACTSNTTNATGNTQLMKHMEEIGKHGEMKRSELNQLHGICSNIPKTRSTLGADDQARKI